MLGAHADIERVRKRQNEQFRGVRGGRFSQGLGDAEVIENLSLPPLRLVEPAVDSQRLGSARYEPGNGGQAGQTAWNHSPTPSAKCG